MTTRAWASRSGLTPSSKAPAAITAFAAQQAAAATHASVARRVLLIAARLPQRELTRGAGLNSKEPTECAEVLRDLTRGAEYIATELALLCVKTRGAGHRVHG